MAHGDQGCSFCGVSGPLVPLAVLDQQWCQRFGGGPVVALDHGWYRGVRGERRRADVLDPARFFDAHVRVACDFCAHGWLEDLRSRAEPAVLAVARGEGSRVALDQMPTLHRWAHVTAILADFIHGMPRASSPGQRDAVRRGVSPSLPVRSWVFGLRQRLPARIHLSQVAVPQAGGEALLQVVSVDLAHCCAVMLVPSSETAAALIDRSSVAAVLAGPLAAKGGAGSVVRALDLATTPHPHRVAVERLCGAAVAPVVGRALDDSTPPGHL